MRTELVKQFSYVHGLPFLLLVAVPAILRQYGDPATG
jgi:hypothetical protein